MHHNNVFLKTFRITMMLALCIYLYFLVDLTILKRLSMVALNYSLDFDTYFRFSVNLVPFKTILGYIMHPPSGKIAMTNIGGNILAFMPLGFLIPAMLEEMRNFKNVFLIVVGTSLTIEIVQLILRIGSSDVDDIILNTIGGFVGYILLCMAIKVHRKFTDGNRDYVSPENQTRM